MRRPSRIELLTAPAGARVVIDLPPGGSLLVVAPDFRIDVTGGTVRRGAPVSATTDLRVERALRAMNGDPLRRWTLEDLAVCAGMSRAAFTRAFRRATGASPLRHLAHERIERSVELLRDTALGLAEIAARVGYANEFSFSRAFKRQFGVAPALVRRALAADARPRCAA